MPYKFIVDRKDGNRVEVADIHLGPTPAVGSEVELSIEGKMLRAAVFNVRTFPSKSPGTAVQTVDHVDVREI
jgi:hypothetical protein